MVLHVFVGPTLPAAEVLDLAPGCVVHPPVQHGDLLRLGPGRDDAVLILDGLFFQAPAVRHKELLHLVRQGVPLAGASSMGALRAAELDGLGMRGIGQVFEWYATGMITADDEVAVAHAGADEDYRRLSTPLVSIRYALSRMVGPALSGGEADALLRLAQRVPFQQRNWTRLRQEAEQAGLLDVAIRARAYLDLHPEHADIKRQDALAAVRSMTRDARPGSAKRSLEPLDTVYLADWRWENEGATSGGHVVPDRLALGFLRLFLPAYPQIHRLSVLAAIAAEGGRPVRGSGELTDAALRVARDRGLTGAGGDLLTPGLARWLAPGERDGAGDRELALRALVRSFRTAPGVRVGHAFPPIVRDSASLLGLGRAGAAAAVAMNEAKRRSDPGFQVEHLRPDAVEEYFRRRWGAVHLEFEALDRGLTGLGELHELGRLFLLFARTGRLPEKALSAVRLSARRPGDGGGEEEQEKP